MLFAVGESAILEVAFGLEALGPTNNGPNEVCDLFPPGSLGNWGLLCPEEKKGEEHQACYSIVIVDLLEYLEHVSFKMRTEPLKDGFQTHGQENGYATPFHGVVFTASSARDASLAKPVTPAEVLPL